METRLYKLRHAHGERDTYMLYYKLDSEMPWHSFDLGDASNVAQAMMHFDNLSLIKANCIGIGTTPVEIEKNKHES